MSYVPRTDYARASQWPDAETRRKMAETPWRTFRTPAEEARQRAAARELLDQVNAYWSKRKRTPKGVWCGG